MSTEHAASYWRRGTGSLVPDRAHMSPTPLSPPPLSSLLRKAAVDSGFDLEPEMEVAWWRLRASGVPGVVWVHPLRTIGGALLAIPTAATFAEIGSSASSGSSDAAGGPVLPPGAAGMVLCPSAHALHEALRRVWALRAHAPERLKARWEAEVFAALGPKANDPVAPSTTEVIAEVRRRVGQNLFREALLDYWDGRCSVTGLAMHELLRASHAKPWAVATDTERLDVHNGLLLAVHLDALFDQGLLTFDENGQGQLSSQLQPDALAVLGLSAESLSLSRVTAAHQPYLAHHRAQVFRP